MHRLVIPLTTWCMYDNQTCILIFLSTKLSNLINLERWVDLHSEKLLFACIRTREEFNKNEMAKKQRYGAGKSEKEL